MEKLLTNRVFQTALLLILLLVAVSLGFSKARWREQIRNFTFDNYNIMKPREAGNDIVIIDIDEASLAKVGQMPWPRSLMADMVRNLSNLGAKVIVFDIVFSEPDRSSPTEIAKQFEGFAGFEDIIPRLSALKDNDAILGLAIGNSGNVITGFSFTNEETGLSPRQVGIFRGKDVEKFVHNMVGATVNLKEINRYAAGNGSFFVSTDTDGVIRRVPMLVAHHRTDTNIITIHPSLALETMRVLDGDRGGRVLLSDERFAELDPGRFGVKAVQIGKDGRVIPTNPRGEFLVYFARTKKDWFVSAHKILDGSVEPEKIKDKIVFIGTSAVGLKDIRSTPLNPFVPGVEVHLNIVDQILQGQFLSRPIEAEGLEALSILLVGLVIIILSSFFGALLQGALVSVIIGGALYAGWYAFTVHGLLIDVTYPSMAVLAIFMLSAVLTYLRTEAERRKIRDAFGHYISPDYLRELTEDTDKLKLGGEIKELTVMFSDIRQFTNISEGLPPEDLIQLMNDFLTPMSDVVMQNRGTIDKYIGDAIMAFWNAPLDDPDHARHACIAALGMQEALENLNTQLEEKAKEEGGKHRLLRAGIGINTGACAVGNMGSKQRFAYSALGDPVNLAARFENQTKSYKVPIIIGETTRKKAGSGLAFLELDLVQVHGKTVPTHIYTLLGDEKYAALDEFKNWSASHAKMLEAFRARDFDRAYKLAQECIKQDKYKKLQEVYDMYLARITGLIKAPPKEDWDGVYKLAK